MCQGRHQRGDGQKMSRQSGSGSGARKSRKPTETEDKSNADTELKSSESEDWKVQPTAAQLAFIAKMEDDKDKADAAAFDDSLGLPPVETKLEKIVEKSTAEPAIYMPRPKAKGAPRKIVTKKGPKYRKPKK